MNATIHAIGDDRLHMVLSRIEKVSRHGSYWTAKCPTHDDRHPSLSITLGDDQRILMRCHANQGCTYAGIMTAIGMEEQDGFAEDRRKEDLIVSKYSYTDEEGTELYQKVRAFPKRFFQRRPDGKGGYENGLGDVRRVLYRLPDLMKATGETVIVVEGEKDADKLHNLDFIATTSESAGNWRDDYSEMLRGRTVCIIPDNDDPGRDHAEKVRASLEGVARKVAVLTLPGLEPKGDVSDWIDAGGTAEGLRVLIERALDPLSGEVIRFRDHLSELEHIRTHGFTQGVNIGLPEVDRIFRPRKQDLVVFTGTPGSGKSTFWDFVMIQTAVRHDWKWLIFSPENMPVVRHQAVMLGRYYRKPYPKLADSEMRKGAEILNDHFFWIDPGEKLYSVDRLLEIAYALHDREKIDGFILDPWNEVDHRRPRELSETEYISHALTELRRFARTRSAVVCVIAHPTKLEKTADGNYPLPTPYQISGSANWRNKADVCLAIGRDDGNLGRCELHTQKIRFDESGWIGCADLRYDKSTGNYYSWSNHKDDQQEIRI